MSINQSIDGQSDGKICKAFNTRANGALSSTNNKVEKDSYQLFKQKNCTRSFYFLESWRELVQ